jgi:hypothetical protein
MNKPQSLQSAYQASVASIEISRVAFNFRGHGTRAVPPAGQDRFVNIIGGTTN